MELKGKNKLIFIGVAMICIWGPLIGFVVYNNNQIQKEQVRKTSLYLYNPHAQPMHVELGNQSYDLEAEEKLLIALTEGEHKAQSWLGERMLVDSTIRLDANVLEKGGVLNLSQEPLYRWVETYQDTNEERRERMQRMQAVMKQVAEQQRNLSAEEQEGLNEEEEIFGAANENSEVTILWIDSTLVVGRVHEYPANHLVLEKNWYYDIDEEFEDEIESHTGEYTTLGTPDKQLAKLFSKQGLLNYLQEEEDALTNLETLE